MRNIFILIVILSAASGTKVQASTIVLKDGRNITGDIVEQSDSKVIVKVNDISLTYYQDGIASIDGKPFAGSHAKVDPVKEGLAIQFLEIFPTGNLVDKLAVNFVSKKQRQAFLIFLKDNLYIQRFAEMRKGGLMENFSSTSLKAAIDFYTSPEGEHFRGEMDNYSAGPILELRGQMQRDMEEAMRQFKRDKGNSLMEQPSSAEPSIKADPEKEKLVDQFLEIFPTEDLVNAAIMGMGYGKLQQSFLKFLKDNSYIQKFTEMRKNGLMKSFSVSSLKAGIDFYTSPEGEHFRTEMKNYSAGSMLEFQKLMFQQMKIAKMQFKQIIRNDHSEQPFSGNSP